MSRALSLVTVLMLVLAVPTGAQAPACRCW